MPKLNYEQRRVESMLAAAHRSLWLAAALAESWRDQGTADDLYAIAGEVGRVHVSLFGQRAAPARDRPARRGAGGEAEGSAA